jgi:hypothetical protein
MHASRMPMTFTPHDLAHGLARLPQVLVRAVAAIRHGAAAIRRHVRALSPERFFWSAVAALLLLYLIALWVQPTGVGRGGR